MGERKQDFSLLIVLYALATVSFFNFILLLLSMESLLRGISSFFLCAIKLTRDFHGGVQELLNLTNAFAREVELSM